MGIFKKIKDFIDTTEYRKTCREHMGKLLLMEEDRERKYPPFLPNYSKYSLIVSLESGDESDELFFPISADIIKSIAKTYHGVVSLKSYYSWEKRNDFKDPLPVDCEMISRCHDFLSCYNLTSFTDERKEKLINISDTDFSIFNFLAREDHYRYSVFCYKEVPDITSFKSWDELYPKNDYAVYFEHDKQPDYLSIIIDTEKVDISHIITAIKEILRGYGKTLLIEISEK